MDDINVPDIEAIDDVLAALDEQADDLPLGRALALRAALTSTKRKVSDTLSNIEMRLHQLAKEPVHYEGVRIASVAKIADVPDQPKLRQLIRQASLTDHEGNKLATLEEVAARAAELWSKGYVSPSTMPKVWLLRELRVRNSDVSEQKEKGWELVEEPDA